MLQVFSTEGNPAEPPGRGRRESPEKAQPALPYPTCLAGGRGPRLTCCHRPQVSACVHTQRTPKRPARTPQPPTSTTDPSQMMIPVTRAPGKDCDLALLSGYT